MRDTFMKVGQSLLVKRQLGMEKQLKEKMIHSVMPPKVTQIFSMMLSLYFPSSPAPPPPPLTTTGRSDNYPHNLHWTLSSPAQRIPSMDQITIKTPNHKCRL